ncbi:hypothetical protein D0T90_01830 [Neisseria animalis]|uniref:Uncharacterized protein n=1 Tax=Neisseria animalis TaxID=492 RepID=A0A5P3MQQ6_NEIAN|nr:hypothetical protein D0T90_01830 [Neisseria animalis]ROW33241.1 hypothetical protein CGZ60_00570 [Neisseria animalis]
MPCRTMCTVCGFAALSHSYFIRLYFLYPSKAVRDNRKIAPNGFFIVWAEKSGSLAGSWRAAKAVCKMRFCRRPYFNNVMMPSLN